MRLKINANKKNNKIKMMLNLVVVDTIINQIALGKYMLKEMAMIKLTNFIQENVIVNYQVINIKSDVKFIKILKRKSIKLKKN